MNMRRKIQRSMHKAKMEKLRKRYKTNGCQHKNQGFKRICPDCGGQNPESLYPGPYNYQKD